MRSEVKMGWRGLFLVATSLLMGTASASAQGFGLGDSLGGYGATSRDFSPEMGGGGAMVIPYGGMTEGFMPGRMGGGSALAFRSRPTTSMGLSRTTFRLSPMSGGMARGSAARSSMSDLRGGSGTGGRGMRVMPPSIGYPFRQPPRLLTPSSSALGMSM